jgi:hypothetical protein
MFGYKSPKSTPKCIQTFIAHGKQMNYSKQKSKKQETEKTIQTIPRNSIASGQA